MKDYPVYIDVIKIKDYLRSLESKEKRVDYLVKLKDELGIIIRYYSDEQISNYIKEHNIPDKDYINIVTDEINIGQAITSFIITLNSTIGQLSSKYSHFIVRIKFTVIPFINSELEKNGIIIYKEDIKEIKPTERLLLPQNTTDNQNIQLIFSKDEIKDKLKSFKDSSLKLEWINKYKIEITNILECFSEEEMDDMNKKYNIQIHILKEDYPLIVSKYKKRINEFKNYQTFLYIEFELLEFIEKRLFITEMEIKYNDTRKHIRQKKLSVEEMYLKFDYKHSAIMVYCDIVFKRISEKIEYLSYLLKQYKIDMRVESLFIKYRNKRTDNDIALLKIELEHLEKLYEHRKDERKFRETTSANPASSIKEYINLLNGNVNNHKNSNDEKLVSNYNKNKRYIDAAAGEKEKKAENKSGKIEKPNRKVDARKSNPSDSVVIKNSGKLKWLGSLKQLKILLYELQDNDFIENHLDNDKEHKQYLSLFVDSNNTNYSENKPAKVIWKSETSELAYLIGELSKSRSKSFIHGTKKWVRASKVFFNQYGDDITPGTLNSSYGKKTITANQEILNRIIKDIYKSS